MEREAGTAEEGVAHTAQVLPTSYKGERKGTRLHTASATRRAGSPHLSSGLLGHVVSISGLQLLLLAGCPVLPSQVPHTALILELPALMAAQLHVPKQDLLISQFGLQVLQLFPLPLRQVFPTRLLTELRDLGQGGTVRSSSYQRATLFPAYSKEVWGLLVLVVLCFIESQRQGEPSFTQT